MKEATASADAHGHGDHGHGHANDGRVHAHISSWQFLVAIFTALIFLTVVTVAVSYVDLGAANTVVAVLVATMKASLVATFFMHLRHDKLFNSIIFVMAFVFLGVFLMLTLDDLGTRGRVDEASGTRIYRKTGEVAPGGMPETPPPASQTAPSPANTHNVPSGSNAPGSTTAPTGHH